MNVKGQRERKLQENLKKIKDRLKLKRPKRVAAAKLAEGEGQPGGVEVAAEGSNTKNEEGVVVPTETAEGGEGPSVVNEAGSEVKVEGPSKQVEMKNEEAKDEENED